MPDIIKTENTLKLDYNFVDGDTRTNNIKNPKDNITAEQIGALETKIRANNLIIGDKSGATFARIKATKIRKTTTTFDIN